MVPGEDGHMVHADTFEQAMEIRKKYPQKISKEDMRRDARQSATLWHKFYFGIEPKSIIQDRIYQRKLKKAASKH